MIRVIGSFQYRSPKNSRVRAFVEWLSKFEGCQFTSEDWRHFKGKVNERKDYYNRGVKDGGYRIGVSFGSGQICVECSGGLSGDRFSQLFATVIPVKSVYSRQLGEAVLDSYFTDEDGEGGES